MSLEELFVQCSTNCVTPLLPLQTDACNPETWDGRIKEILFVPCTEQIDDAWVLDLANWTSNFVGAGHLGRRTGLVKGSYQKTGGSARDIGGELPTIVGVKLTYELTAQKIIVDRTQALETHKFATALQKGAINGYFLFATYVNNPDMILPIGKVALTDFNNVLPEGLEDMMYFEYKFSWKQHGAPEPILVLGLGAVLNQ